MNNNVESVHKYTLYIYIYIIHMNECVVVQSIQFIIDYD